MHVSSTYRPQNQLLPQGNLSAAASYTFSAKEKDSETNLTYFGARYYASDLSIWLSVDPMSAKYPSLSPYIYCANNPIKLVDPNGEEIGDYFNIDGKWLGTDGIDDGKVYLVTGESNGSQSDNPRMQYNEDEIHRIPSSENDRRYIVDKLVEFDKNNPNAEWGGVCGDVIDSQSEHLGTEQTVWGDYGKTGDPKDDVLTYTQVSKTSYNGYIIFFDFHSHSSGGWKQEPSSTDIENVAQRQNFYPKSFAVFAMKDKVVHFYNNSKKCASISFERFISITK